MADIDDALQSGVLNLVPPGTQGWRLTYHEFKELVKLYFFDVKKFAVKHLRVAAAIRRKGKLIKRGGRVGLCVHIVRASHG